MASSVDTIMGSLFSIIVFAGFIAMGIYGVLSPTILAATIIAFLVIWYLARGADVDPPSTTSSRDNRTPSNNPSGDGPDLDGPSLDDSSTSDGPPPSTDSKKPELSVEIKKKNNVPLKKGITSSEIALEYEIHDRSGKGLDKMEVELEGHGAIDENLAGQKDVVSAAPLNMLFGNFSLRPGDYNYLVKVADNEGKTAVVSDSFPVSNKNDNSEGDSMEDTTFGTIGDEIDSDIDHLEEEARLLKEISKMDKDELDNIKEAHEALKKAEKRYKDVLSHLKSIEKIEGSNNQLSRQEIIQEELDEIQKIEDDVAAAEQNLEAFERKVGYIGREVDKERQYENKLENLEGQVVERQGQLEDHIRKIEEQLGADLNR